MTRFIIVTPTLVDGLIPAEWDGNGPVTYATRAEADTEVEECAESAEDAGSDAFDESVEECEVMSDGSIRLVHLNRTWTLEDMRKTRGL